MVVNGVTLYAVNDKARGYLSSAYTPLPRLLNAVGNVGAGYAAFIVKGAKPFKGVAYGLPRSGKYVR